MPHEELRFWSLGSNCHLLIAGAAGGRLTRGAAWVAAMHDRFSRFIPGSELSRFNRAAGSGWTAVSGEMEALLRAALAAHELSGGLVHAGLLGAIRATGYTRSLALGPTAPGPAVAPPPLPEILQVRPTAGRLAPGAGVDLGGIAKGWMADRLAVRLGGNCLVNLGGDLYARGGGPDGAGWPVAMGGRTLLLEDQGAATSGTRSRSWEHGGGHFHHLLDPRPGRPSSTGLAEVSVVSGTATDAEVHAKTALLLGPGSAPAYLAGHAQAWWVMPA